MCYKYSLFIQLSHGGRKKTMDVYYECSYELIMNTHTYNFINLIHVKMKIVKIIYMNTNMILKTCDNYSYEHKNYKK